MQIINRNGHTDNLFFPYNQRLMIPIKYAQIPVSLLTVACRNGIFFCLEKPSAGLERIERPWTKNHVMF